MSDKIIYYNTNTEKVIGAYGGAQLLNKYTLSYKACPIWEIHFVTIDEEGQYIPTDMTRASTWRAAVDTDFKAETQPMVRTLPEKIDSSLAQQGILFVEVDADTQTFLNKVNGKQSVNATFEIRGTNTDGKTIFTYRFGILCYGAVDPYRASPLPVASGVVSQDWVLALLRAGREIQFSADGVEWHETQDIINDRYYRERYPNGEWSEAIWFKDDPAPNTKIQYSEDGVEFTDEATLNSNYIRFSTDNGLTWSNYIYATGKDGTNGYGFTFLGAYSNSQVYSLPTDDVPYFQAVYYNGSSWIYTGSQPTSGNLPPTTIDETSNYWTLFAAKGVDGVDGDIEVVTPEKVEGLDSYIKNISYTKAETDSKITSDLTNYYTKSNVDSLLNAKANTSNVYSKTEIDAKFDLIGGSQVTQDDLANYVPLSTYNTDINVVNTALTNVQADLDEKLEKTTVYDIGEVNSSFDIDGKLGDYQTFSIAADATITMGQDTFFNFDTGTGIVLEISKPTTGSILVIDGKIILTANDTGTYLIGVFRNSSKYIITAPTEVIN